MILKRDVIVLVPICGFAILCAGALGLGGDRAQKMRMCTANLAGIGQAMSMYVDEYDGKLPTLQNYKRSPTSGRTVPFTPSIESTYLLSARTWSSSGSLTGPMAYRHLGCLYGAGYVGDGQMLFCPANAGWRGDATSMGQNNGTYFGAVSPTTGIFGDLSYPVNQGWKATLGYCYWPLSTRRANQMALDGIDSATARTRYKLGLPLSATKLDDLDTTRPLVADRRFHPKEAGDWMLNCLYMDGRVLHQKQPKAEGLNGYGVQGTWGLYSDQENCQLPTEIINSTSPVTVKDATEKGYQLATAVTPTEFAWALQP